MELIQTLNRTMKLALDDGSAASVEEAEQLFRTFHLQIVVGQDVQHNPSLQAALLTLLNAAPRTFLGDVTIVGALDFNPCIGWQVGEPLRAVAESYGVSCSRRPMNRMSVFVGCRPDLSISHQFQLHLSVTARGFVLSPDAPEEGSVAGCIESGVAAAGAALNECFQSVYFRRAWAGRREIEFALPGAGRWNTSGPKLIWVVGLGHVGQAFLWCKALGATQGYGGMRLWLQDFDHVSASSLSTGLLTRSSDIGLSKVTVVAREMRKIGMKCAVSEVQADPAAPPPVGCDLCVVAVDNFAFRRQLDKLRGPRIVEGGIGDGVRGFTRMQIHELPGKRTAADIWCEADPAATSRVSVTPRAYQKLIRDGSDECGIAQLAGRSIATPFAGAFLGALLCSIASHEPSDQDSFAFDVNCLGR